MKNEYKNKIKIIKTNVKNEKISHVPFAPPCN